MSGDRMTKEDFIECTETLIKTFERGIKEKIVSLAIDGLTTDGAHHKQFYLEEILSHLITDNQEWDGIKDTYDWGDGITP